MNLNTRITKYFINNPRFTILLLIFLVLFGIGSVSLLKTTGFPSPEIKLVLVNTLYPGASANTVLEQVTKPLEVAIKTVDGIESYTTFSNNNFSNINISIKENANLDSIRTKIDSVLKQVNLPEGVQKPQILSPKISGDAYYFSLINKNSYSTSADNYNATEILKNEIEKDSDINKVNLIGGNLKKFVVNIDQNKLKDTQINVNDISTQIQQWDKNKIPVGKGAVINNLDYNLSFILNNKNIDDLRTLNITSPYNSKISYKLQDLADVNLQYIIDGNVQPYSAYNDNGNVTAKSTLITIDISEQADLSKYDPKLQKIINKYFDTSSEDYKNLNQSDKNLFNKFKLIKIYSIQDSNQAQVKEVVSGLIGGKIGNSPLGNLGYIFGGIELVFIAMLFIISWRAALISALAIPLSFFFSTIILKLTGNDLNTLVLFSLVLVIGLVVDPALVVLESIQRNLDNGLKGKKAVLNAIHEIGGGLFLAVLTSVLVFIPFGVVSGIFGQIISYIPLTILPALVGSYLVPLIFLSWLGSLILKRNKKSHDSKNEEENLWPISKWMIKTNEKILNSKWYIRLTIIILAIIIPFIVAGIFIGTRKVKFVQFAQASDADRIEITLRPLSQQTNKTLENNYKDIISETIKNNNVAYVSPFGSLNEGNSSTKLVVVLKDKSDRDIKAVQIAKDISLNLNNKFANEFFDISANAEGVGVSTSNFPISLSVKTSNFDDEKKIALDLTTILNTVCKGDKAVAKLDKNCSDSNKLIQKVDNGYNSQVNKFVEIKLNKNKLKDNPVNIIQVINTLSNLYNNTDTTKLANIVDNNNDLDVVIGNNNAINPKNIDEIKNTDLRNLLGKSIKLSDIADIAEVESLSSIQRIKGENIGVINAKVDSDLIDQSTIVLIQKLVINEFNSNYKQNYLTDTIVSEYSEGTSASISKSFGELGLAFLLAIVLTYVVLVIFFNSISQPFVILFSIPLTFLGIFPAIAAFGGGQLGFLEIIGIIILVGLVENVGIFLMSAANQKVKEGWEIKKAIAYASGVRFRPIFLTKVTTLVSTAPLAILSEQYRSLSVVIIFGLLTSGFVSLFISPILYVFFSNLSLRIRRKLRIGYDDEVNNEI